MIRVIAALALCLCLAVPAVAQSLEGTQPDLSLTQARAMSPVALARLFVPPNQAVTVTGVDFDFPQTWVEGGYLQGLSLLQPWRDLGNSACAQTVIHAAFEPQGRGITWGPDNAARYQGSDLQTRYRIAMDGHACDANEGWFAGERSYDEAGQAALIRTLVWVMTRARDGRPLPFTIRCDDGCTNPRQQLSALALSNLRELRKQNAGWREDCDVASHGGRCFTAQFDWAGPVEPTWRITLEESEGQIIQVNLIAQQIVSFTPPPPPPPN